MGRFTTIFFFLMAGIIPGAQAQIFPAPQKGFEKRIHDAVYAVRLLDSHEHLMPEKEALQAAADFSVLFTNYQVSDLVSAGGLTEDKLYRVFKAKDIPLEQKWDVIKMNWPEMRTTAYGRSILIAARDLYEVNDLNENTYKELSSRIAQMHKPGYYEKILKDKSKIDACLIMEYNTVNPRDVETEGNCNFRRFFVYDKYVTFRCFNKMVTKLSVYGKKFQTLAGYEALIDSVFLQDVAKGIQGAKFGVAYSRTLKFEDVSREAANAVFGKLKSDPDHEFTYEEAKPLQDYIFFKLLGLCSAHNVPVQIHTGLQTGSGNDITNSNPTGLVKAFFKFPNVKFCLLHSGYPYGGEMATLAKNFPNVYIDMAWAALISPGFTRRYLEEFLETVPANKIMAFGGDSQTVEGAYGASVLARETVAQTLIHMVGEQTLTENEALGLAVKLLRENAIQIYNVKL